MKLFEIVILFFVVTTRADHFQDEEACESRLVIAFSEVSYLTALDRDTDDVTVLTPATNLRNPIAVAADQANGYVFFTDVELRQIWRKDFKTPANSEMVLQLGPASVPDGIAVDATNQRVFYTDFGEDLIAAMDYNGANHDVILRDSTSSRLDQVRAIVLQPDTRTMYYTNWGNNSHISKASYDGTNVVILQNDNLLFPNGLAADFINNRLYWCDAGLDYIASMTLSGTDARILFRVDEEEIHPFGLILVHNELLISDWEHRRIFSLPLDDTSTMRSITSASFTKRPNGIAEICLPTSHERQETTPTVVALDDSSDGDAQDGNGGDNNSGSSSGGGGGGGDSTPTIIIIAMSIFGGLVALTVIAVTSWCCLKTSRTTSGNKPDHAPPTVSSAVPAATAPKPPPYHTYCTAAVIETSQPRQHGVSNPAYTDTVDEGMYESLRIPTTQQRQSLAYGDYLNPVTSAADDTDTGVTLREGNSDDKRASGVYLSIAK